METLLNEDFIKLLIAKKHFRHALAAVSYLPREKRSLIYDEIIATLLTPSALFIDEAREFAEDLPEPQKNFWLKRIYKIELAHCLFDDARYTAGKIDDNGDGNYTIAVMKEARKTGQKDAVNVLNEEELVTLYVSLGMLKRARKFAKELPEAKRNAYSLCVPKGREDEEEKKKKKRAYAG